MKIKKGDEIIVLSGKYRGERAKIEFAMPASDQVVLDSLNIAKRHTKQTGSMTQAGIIDKFMPMHVSNVALWCGGHKGPAKAGFVFDDQNNKVRVCRKCGDKL